MILITVDIIKEELPRKLNDYEKVYKLATKLQQHYFVTFSENRIYVLVDNDEDYFKICYMIILAINSEALTARLYISQSNEHVELNNLDVLNNKYQVFKLNTKLRKECLRNKTFRKSSSFAIRANHPMLDSILYSLSVLCFKHERNLELLNDKYYLKLTQIQIAEKYNISQVAVSKKLRSSNYEMFKMIVGRL
ncbi:hypothetical protein RZE82_02780 [Mollicutes bacterium LVI A0039]|nr:hypothetical protein RZE82_02780 [Mollicutes bacterium LVI A0039]